MALSKSIEVKNQGVFATYWIVHLIQFDIQTGQTWATLRGYLNQTAFNAGKSYMDERSYTAPTPANFSVINGSQIIEAIYQYVMTQPEFVGSTEI